MIKLIQLTGDKKLFCTFLEKGGMDEHEAIRCYNTVTELLVSYEKDTSNVADRNKAFELIKNLEDAYLPPEFVLEGISQDFERRSKARRLMEDLGIIR
ncbi:hypothetical protein O4H52_12685 [Sphingomonadaceae bacterium G21617-S1]|nr:hypothetical protein [Sphingomonadaceae bacterium G21617-S1]